MAKKIKAQERIYTHTLADIELEIIYTALDKYENELAERVRKQKPAPHGTFPQEKLKASVLRHGTVEGLLTAFEDALEDHQDGAIVRLVVRPIA